MALKRAGRGHDPAGIGATSPGSLTVECPACPHPNRNMPDNWEQAGPLMYVFLSRPGRSDDFIQVSLHLIYLCRRKFQAQGQRARLEGR